MFEIFEDILLSEFLMFFVLALMLLGVTAWALRNKDYAGYALGWLVGILTIIIYQTLTGGRTTGEEAETVVRPTEVTLTAIMVIFPAMLGLFSGFGSMFFLRVFGSSQRTRATSVAIFTALLVLGIYLVFGLSDRASRIVAIFALAFGVGSLSNIVLGISSLPGTFRYNYNPGEPPPPVSAQSAPSPYEIDQQSPSADLRIEQAKFDRLRRSIKRPK
jgi:hypothetical protein